MSEVRVGVYPGTFDPTTLGHVDIVKRALRVVDRRALGVPHGVGLVDRIEPVNQTDLE